MRESVSCSVSGLSATPCTVHVLSSVVPGAGVEVDMVGCEWLHIWFVDQRLNVPCPKVVLCILRGGTGSGTVQVLNWPSTEPLSCVYVAGGLVAAAELW